MSNRNEFNSNLRIDRVVGSQPELGPSIPDGGYGWIILFASLFLQIFIPSILASFGIFMLYARIESSQMSEDPQLWDVALLPTPIVFMAFWTLADPWSKTIVATSTWPRLVTTAGIFLTCAGMLIQWAAMRDSSGIFIYMLAGAISGFGSSLAIVQSETLVNQYFRLKLVAANNLLNCAYSFGFIITPIMLGFLIVRKGILHSILIYQAIILQCVIIIMVFKKPLYLKAVRRRYELLQNASEDDEMIFAKDDTELASSATINENPTPSGSTNPDASSTTTNNETIQQSRKKSALLVESFAGELPSEAIQQEDTPRPIFTEVEIMTTNVYTFDNNVVNVDDNNITFAPPPERIVASNFRQEVSFLWKLSFYKSLLFIIAFKYSASVFWILFPTYLYVEMDKLQVQQTTFLVGAMGLGSLFIGLFSSFLPVYGSNRQTITAGFCCLSSVGYFILSDAGTEGWLLFGALHVTTGITGLHVLNPSVTKYILGADCDKAHTLLHTLAGISVLLLLVKDSSYRNCFRVMALLQIITAFILFSNFLFKYFKKLFNL